MTAACHHDCLVSHVLTLCRCREFTKLQHWNAAPLLLYKLYPASVLVPLSRWCDLHHKRQCVSMADTGYIFHMLMTSLTIWQRNLHARKEILRQLHVHERSCSLVILPSKN